MPLPNPSMSFSPFAILTAEEMNNIIENIESLQDGTAFDSNSIDADFLLDDSLSIDKIDIASLGIIANTGSTTVSLTAPAAGIIYVEFVKVYYSTAGTPTAGNATIDLPAGGTNIYSIAPSGGNLGAVTYATTLVAKRKFSVAAGGVINITTSGGNGAGVISTSIVATYTPF